jgi:hypothetical protein
MSRLSLLQKETSTVGGKLNWDRVNRENRALRAARCAPDSSEEKEPDLAALKQWHRALAERPLEIRGKSPKAPKGKSRKSKRKGPKVLLGIEAYKKTWRQGRRREQAKHRQALLEERKRNGL